MNAKELAALLRAIGACREAVEWTKGKTFEEAWKECVRADWMLWLCGKMVGTAGWPTKQEIVLLACDFAESSLKYWEKKHPNDKRPHEAIAAARAWAQSGATSDSDVAKKLRGAAAAAAAAYAEKVWTIAVSILDEAIRLGRQAEQIETALVIERMERAKEASNAL